MARKTILGLTWLSLVIYSIGFTIYGVKTFPPGAFERDLDLIINMSVLEWEGINPIIIAIFYIMGIFPLVYGAFILFDSDQKVSPYPFFITSFGLGAFTLLPYFVLRQPNTSWNKQKGWLLKVLDSRLTAIASSIAIIVFIVWGITQGSWSDFIAQRQTSQFINVMSLDFCLLCFLLPVTILKDDMIRRGIKEQKFFWLAAIFPLFGSLFYWCVRPQLKSSSDL